MATPNPTDQPRRAFPSRPSQPPKTSTPSTSEPTRRAAPPQVRSALKHPHSRRTPRPSTRRFRVWGADTAQVIDLSKLSHDQLMDRANAHSAKAGGMMGWVERHTLDARLTELSESSPPVMVGIGFGGADARFPAGNLHRFRRDGWVLRSGGDGDGGAEAGYSGRYSSAPDKKTGKKPRRSSQGGADTKDTKASPRAYLTHLPSSAHPRGTSQLQKRPSAAVPLSGIGVGELTHSQRVGVATPCCPSPRAAANRNPEALSDTAQSERQKRTLVAARESVFRRPARGTAAHNTRAPQNSTKHTRFPQMAGSSVIEPVVRRREPGGGQARRGRCVYTAAERGAAARRAGVAAGVC
jgi:hypothetical protein